MNGPEKPPSKPVRSGSMESNTYYCEINCRGKVQGGVVKHGERSVTVDVAKKERVVNEAGTAYNAKVLRCLRTEWREHGEKRSCILF